MSREKFPCRESNPGYGGENDRTYPLDHMGYAKAWYVFAFIFKIGWLFNDCQQFSKHATLVVDKSPIRKQLEVLWPMGKQYNTHGSKQNLIASYVLFYVFLN